MILKRFIFIKIRAFTLVEVMIAFLILGLAIIPIISLFSGSWKGTNRSQSKVAAMKLAEEKLNFYLNLKYNKINASYVSKEQIIRDNILFGVSLEWTVVPLIRYNYKTVRIIGGITKEITKFYDCKKSLKKLLIKVTWKDGKIDKVFTLETYKADVPALQGQL